MVVGECPRLVKISPLVVPIVTEALPSKLTEMTGAEGIPAPILSDRADSDKAQNKRHDQRNHEGHAILVL